MRAKIASLLSAFLLSGTIAAQSMPCTSVAPEVRDRVREAGACRDATPEDVALKGNAPSGTVTMKLSDGTVVRIPREISSNINEERRRAVTSEAAPPKSVSRAGNLAKAAPGTSRASGPALQTLKVPDVVGRSFADARSALADFKVDRIETASAAPSGEVLAQDPPPATAVLPGSTISLQVSDGSLASAADTAIAPAIEAKTPSSPESADPVPVSATAPAAASDVIVPAAPHTRSSVAFSTHAALILGSGVLFGSLLGALLMRQWLLRRKLEVHEDAALPAAPQQHQQRVEPPPSEPETAPEIAFTARLDPGETTIELVRPPSDEEAEIELSSDHA